MNYRTLGETQLKVSEIAFGSWGIGGFVPGWRSYGPKHDSLSRGALNEAFHQGITLFDTANNYGNGHAEELIGKEFAGKRDKVIIATKGGYLNHFPDDGINQRFDYKALMNSLMGSLIRLRTNYVDIYQLHNATLAHIADNGPLFKFLQDAKAAGMIRFVGIAAKSPDEALQHVVKAAYPFDVLQCNFSLTDQRALDNGLFEAIKATNIGLMVRSPLTHGFLSGRLTPEILKLHAHPSDHRLRFTQATQERWISALKIFDSVFIEKTPHAQQAINFCLSFPEVATVIAGMNTPAQVAENAGASALRHLTKATIEKIRGQYKAYFKNYPVQMNC